MNKLFLCFLIIVGLSERCEMQSVTSESVPSSQLLSLAQILNRATDAFAVHGGWPNGDVR